MILKETIRPPKIYAGEEGEFSKLRKLMTNTCKVQLIDPLTNKVKDERFAKNFLTNYYTRLAIQDQFMAPIFSNSAARVPADLPWNAIYLSDNTSAIDGDLKYLPGNIIGYASRDVEHVSVSAYRGTINSAESHKNADLNIELVFDWPTHAANGTIGTVYWSALVAALNSTRAYPPIGGYCSPVAQGIPETETNGPSYTDGDWMYYTTTDNKVYRTRRSSVTSFARSVSDVTELLADLSAIDNSLFGLGKSGTNWYVYGGQYDKIYKFDSSWNLLDSWSLSSSYVATTYSTWLVKNDKIHVVKWVNSTSIMLYRFDLTGSLEASTELYTINPGGNFNTFSSLTANYISLHEDDVNLLVMCAPTTVAPNYAPYSNQSNLLVINPDTHAFVADMPGIINLDSSPAHASTWNAKMKCLESPISYAFPLLHPLAAVLLDTPIEKTSDYTLKISYSLAVNYAEIP